MSQMLEHKHYTGAAHSFEIVTPEDPVAGSYVRPDVTIIKTFYCNDTVNANDWQATWEGLKLDAEELPGTPIVLKEDLQHPKFSVQDYFDRGTIFDYDIDEENKQIIVYARITDLTLIPRIKSGELQYVSPALIPKGSEHMRKVKGVDVLSRTLPLHLAIVGDPAYGKEKAKISHICSGDGKQCYQRLKTMTASKSIVQQIIDREHELLDKGIDEDEVHGILVKEFGAKMSENSGIKSNLKIKNAEGISELEQIPLIKKVLGKAAKVASILNHTDGDYMIHEGQEGTWIKAKGQDVFVAKNQKISEALIEQCGCDQI